MADKPENRWPLLPIAGWLPQYRPAWLRFDLVAGVTLAAYAVPVSLAYAGLAGLPPQTGLYCYLLAGLGYAVFGSSRHLAVGPTSAISLLLGVTLATPGRGRSRAAGRPGVVDRADRGRRVRAGLAAAVERAGELHLREHLDRVQGRRRPGHRLHATAETLWRRRGRGRLLSNAWASSSGKLPDTNLSRWPSAWVRSWRWLLGEKFLPGRPVALGVVLLALVAASLGPVEQQGVKVVGELPAGLPHFQPAGASLGALRIEEFRQLTRLAFACFLLAYIESVSAARTFALKHRYTVDPRQEFLGLGAASLLVGLWQGFPVAGGLSQSAVNEKGGHARRCRWLSRPRWSPWCFSSSRASSEACRRPFWPRSCSSP